MPNETQAEKRARENRERRAKQKADTNKGIKGRISGARVQPGKKPSGSRLKKPAPGTAFLPSPKGKRVRQRGRGKKGRS